MTALYNEIDPFAAAWLRELIKAGHIAPGEVWEHDIRDIRPRDLRGFTQCHFFAGIGVWSYALRRAGWPDDRPVWTGSCPCQPFSAAGAGAGFADERHLWPHFYWLISQCGPAVVLGEQVASKDGLAWLDLVQADLEGSGYASAAVDTCSAGVGAPHIRQRLYWLAHASLNGDRQHARKLQGHEGQYGVWPANGDHASVAGSAARRLADTDAHQSWAGRNGGSTQGEGLWLEPSQRGDAHGMGYANSSGRTHQDPRSEKGPAVGLGPIGTGRLADDDEGLEGRDPRSMGRQRQAAERNGRGEFADQSAAGPINGFWRDADWLFCRDGKWRPVEPGTFPLAHGAPARVGRLRGYGNAINAEQATIFIESVIETIFPEIDAEPDVPVRLTEMFG